MTALGKYNLTASDGTTSQDALGQEINIKGATWVYTKANAAIAAYQVCYFLADGTISLATATLLTTTKPTLICIPQFAFAINEYGYAPVQFQPLREDNSTTFKVLSKIASKDVVMYGTATAGSVDDAVSNPIIQGLVLTAAQTVDDTATACVAYRRLSSTC